MLSHLPRTLVDNAVELKEADAPPLNESNVRNSHMKPFYRENRGGQRRNLLSSIGYLSIRPAAPEPPCAQVVWREPVVAGPVPAFFGVELNGEAAGVAGGIGLTLFAGHGGEAGQ